MPGENMETQNSTPETGASLHDALREAFAAQEAKASAEPEAPEVEEAGEEIEPEEVEETEAEEVEAEDDEPEESPALSAPEHWSADDKSTFNTLAELGDAGRKAQQFLERRHKEMERAANEKFQEAASIRKRGEALDQALGEVKSAWAMQGIDEVTGISSLIRTYQDLGRDPVNTLKTLATQLNVDLSALAQSDDPFADPETKRIKAELEQIKAQLNQSKAQQAQSSQQAVVQQIQAFERETDEAGNPKHPHFVAVWEDMAKLMQVGLATDLPTAYAKAVSHRPELIQADQAKAQAAAAEKAKAEKIARAKRAQKAATGLKSGASSTSANSTKPKTLRDEIAELIERQNRSA